MVPDLPAPGKGVDFIRLREGVDDPHARIKGGEGVLEDDLDGPPEFLQVLSLQGCDVFTLEEDPAVRGVDQLEYQPRHCRFAAAALSDDGENPVTLHAEGDAVDGPEHRRLAQHAAAEGEVFLQ